MTGTSMMTRVITTMRMTMHRHFRVHLWCSLAFFRCTTAFST